jgi:L,D-transpeptidase catalytic domain
MIKIISFFSIFFFFSCNSSKKSESTSQKEPFESLRDRGKKEIKIKKEPFESLRDRGKKEIKIKKEPFESLRDRGKKEITKEKKIKKEIKKVVRTYTACLRSKRMRSIYESLDKGAKVVGRIFPSRCYSILEYGKNEKCKTRFVKFGENAFSCSSKWKISKKKPNPHPFPPKFNKFGLPRVYWKFKNNGIVYSKPDLKSKVKKRLRVRSIVTGYQHPRGWINTGDGYVKKSNVSLVRASRLRGVLLGKNMKLPIAWNIRGRTRVWEKPGKKLLKRISLYTKVTPIKLEGKYYKTNIGYIHKNHLRIAKKMKKPAKVGKNEKWIRISLNNWTLVTYIGDKPIFATLISVGPTTPTGIYPIKKKIREATMGTGRHGSYAYKIFKVPFSQHLVKSIYIHASFGHDSFGSHWSQNCINVTPKDALYLFQWTNPVLPPGWFDIRKSKNNPGTKVFIMRN